MFSTTNRNQVVYSSPTNRCCLSVHCPTSTAECKAVVHLSQREGRQNREFDQHLHRLRRSTAIRGQANVAAPRHQQPADDIQSYPHGCSPSSPKFKVVVFSHGESFLSKKGILYVLRTSEPSCVYCTLTVWCLCSLGLVLVRKRAGGGIVSCEVSELQLLGVTGGVAFWEFQDL